MPWWLLTLLALLTGSNALVWWQIARPAVPPPRRELWRQRLDLQASQPPCLLCHDPAHVWQEHVRLPQGELRQRAEEDRWREGEW